MAKYRKKPVEIEAIQFTDKNKDQVFHWATEIQGNIYPVFENSKSCLRIPTLEGEMT